MLYSNYFSYLLPIKLRLQQPLWIIVTVSLDVVTVSVSDLVYLKWGFQRFFGG